MTPSLRHEAAAWRGAGGSAVEPARCRRVTDASLAFCGRRRRPPPPPPARPVLTAGAIVHGAERSDRRRQTTSPVGRASSEG